LLSALASTAGAAVNIATPWAFRVQVHGRRRMASVRRSRLVAASGVLGLPTRSAVASRGTHGIGCAPCLARRTAVIAGPPCAAQTPRIGASRRMLAGQVADQVARRVKQTLMMLRSTEAPGLARCLSITPWARPVLRGSGPTSWKYAHRFQRWWRLRPGMSSTAGVATPSAKRELGRRWIQNGPSTGGARAAAAQS